jgi:hypothetical protein
MFNDCRLCGELLKKVSIQPEGKNMEATVTTSHPNSHANFTHHISRFSKACGRLMPLLLICVLVSMAHEQSNAQTATPNSTNAAAPSDAQKAFEKMKSLAGSWQGTIRNIPINVTIRVASSGTAILHEANTDGGHPPNHEITMFYVDGDRLLATHYCDGGNRARLEGKLSSDGKMIEFSLLDVAGGTQGGLVKHMAFTVVDANTHVVEFTFMMPNGKAMDLRGEFQRTK